MIIDDRKQYFCVVMVSQDVQTFNLFEFLGDLDIWDEFSVFYDPGDEPGKKVYSFMGRVREKNDEQMVINYTFQDEWYFGHSVCYGVMILNPKIKTVLRYSLKDKYGDYFTPSPSVIFGFFDNVEDQTQLWWNRAVAYEEPSNEKYDRVEWIEDINVVPWTENEHKWGA